MQNATDRRNGRHPIQRSTDAVRIATLKTLPPGIFEQMVKRLVNGHSVRTVARWLCRAGECFGLSFWTFRKYIDAFVPSLRAQVASVRQAASQPSRKRQYIFEM